MTFLSVILSMNDLRMNSKKIKIIVNWARFTNLKKMQVFVNFVNFYRRFIRDFSKKIKILIRMIKKLVSFEWTTKIEEIFNLFKKNDDENFYIATLRSNQTNHFENRFFKLRQRESIISIRRRKNFAFRCFFQSKCYEHVWQINRDKRI